MSYQRRVHGADDRRAGSPVYIFELDREWRIVDLNDAARERLGKGSSVIGRDYWDIFPLSSGTYTRAILEEALELGVSTNFQAFCHDLEAWFQIEAMPTGAGLRLAAAEIVTDRPARLANVALPEEGLSKIADEMRRMADQIIRQAREGTLSGERADDEHWTDKRLARIADAIYRERRRRREHFAVHFAEPQWNILLDLFMQEVRGKRVSITSACIAADVPSSTALRALDELSAKGLISREPDSADKRRAWVTLTPEGMESMRRYLRRSTVRALEM